MNQTPEFLQGNDLAKPQLEGGNLEELYKLVLRYRELQEEIEQHEAYLKNIKQAFLQVSQVAIPDFLGTFNLSEIRLSSGEKLEVKSNVSVTVKDQDRFFDYLRKTDQADMIKDKVTVDDATDAIIKQLIEAGASFDRKRSIHPGALTKFFRLMLEAGQKPPESVTVYTYSHTKIN